MEAPHDAQHLAPIGFPSFTYICIPSPCPNSARFAMIHFIVA